MKHLLKVLAASLLALFARGILAKYKPTIVMVTGSVGKTSTKDAVAAALGGRYFVRASEKSYNSEFGVPLTIIGAKNPWSSPLAWLGVIKESLALLLLKSHYPRLLVLEVGADRPGDLSRILRIATPDAVVVTRLPEVPVHVEAYASPAAVREEEFAPAYALAPGAPLIFSSDDPHARMMGKRTQAKLVSFGYAPDADVRIEQSNVLTEEGRPIGMEATVAVEEKTYTLTAPGALGRPQLLAPAAALATALALIVPAKDALDGLRGYTPPPGRGRILQGRSGSTLIDDSYNSSPAAVEEALAALALVKVAGRKIAVLGDMLELGRYSVEEHERIGVLAAKEVDILATVGIRSRAAAEAARQAGMKEEEVLTFDTAVEAGRTLEDLVGQGDLVLIKGSQSIRMERLAEHLLMRTEDTQLLVRQDREWKKKV